MNITELKIALDAAGVDEIAYSFTSDGIGEVYRLAPVPSVRGEDWEIYYAERGLKTGLQVFRSEAEACDAFLRRMLEDTSTRRAAIR